MSDVEKIKQRLDIVDVISKYIELKQAGSNYKALCPFHGEKTPSFSVNSQLQIYKCFGCGKTGDVINFVQEIERLTFPEALGKTAEMAGVEIEGKFQHKDLASEEKKFRALQATGLAAKYFHHVLMAHEVGKHAREYADKRLLTSKELTKFNFGYATNSYVNLKSFLLERGFSEDELIEFGLLVKREKSVDKFRNRLMQPLYNLEGKVIGFSGRILVKNDKAPKYLNSPESILYKKNEQLYSLFHAKEAIRKQGFVILVEGNLDVVSSHRVGVENIVAPLGTAFTPNQAKLIKRFSDKVYICFDTDKAGIGATGRTLKILEDEGIEHRVIDLGEYQDCDEMIRAGAKLWIKAIENNMETYEYLKQALTKDIDLGSADAKTQIKKLIMPIIQSYKGDVKINHYVRDLSLILEVSQESLINELGNNIKKRPSFFDKEESVENTKENIDAKPTEADKLEEMMLSMIISNPELLNLIDNDEIFTNNLNHQLFIILAETNCQISDEISKTLSVEIQDKYMRLSSMAQTDRVKDFELIYKRTLKHFLNNKVLHLRSRLALDEDNHIVLMELNKLLTKLKEVE